MHRLGRRCCRDEVVFSVIGPNLLTDGLRGLGRTFKPFSKLRNKCSIFFVPAL